MAERRMFAKTIIDSDAFLDMPLSTQAFYFHLSMRADDEGFINNPKKIQRMIGASDDDFKVLIAKNFIIPFESGVVVIKHWKIHNYIRNDRLVATKYTEERERLIIKDNGAYTIDECASEIESMDADDMRKAAYKRSSLPYSFAYKIKRAFEGDKCPVCGAKMSSSCKTTMPTIQHNIPISKGGEHELENISVICESCNVSIKDKETGSLNNATVIETWDKITAADKQGIDWFRNPEVLKTIDTRVLPDKCQSSDGQLSTQVRLGKDNNKIISKDIICQKDPSDLSDIEQIILAWNSLESVGIQGVIRMTSDSSRCKMLKARIKTYGKEDVLTAIENIKQSSFLQGQNKNSWVITFDWFVKPDNFAKVLNGNYLNRDLRFPRKEGNEEWQK